MRNLIFLLVSLIIIGTSISVAEAAVLFIPTEDTPNLSDMAIVNRNPPDCDPPDSGVWSVTSSCFLVNTFVAPSDVMIQNGVLVIIIPDKTLTVGSGNNLTIKFGGGLLIKSGGTLQINSLI